MMLYLIADSTGSYPLSGTLLDEYKGARVRPHSVISFPQNDALHGQNGSGYQPDKDQSARPIRDYVRPVCYVLGGVICLVVAWFFIGYAIPYGSNHEYQTRQYIIDSLICFGLIVIAFLIVAQGVYLIFFSIL